MEKFRRPQGFGWCAVLFLLMGAVGCSRSGDGLQAAGGSQDRGQDVPFHQDAASSATQHPAEAATLESAVPFNNSPLVTLPVGTLLTVRLETVLSGDKRDAGRDFTAVVDSPVILDGSAVLARGTAVRGRVECTHTSETHPGSGFVCLTLDSVLIGGKAVPLQTSSLFARGVAAEAADGGAAGGSTQPRTVVQLRKGHRLTFRLSREVVLARPGAESSSVPLSQGSR